MPSVLLYLALGRGSYACGRGKVCTSLIPRSLHADWRGAEPYAIAQTKAQTLPDDILLEIFEYHRLASIRSGPWKWHKLAQVCRRWRFVVFAYPRLLDLRIISTSKNAIWEIPDFWPAHLPIIMGYRSPLSVEDEDNMFDVLKNAARICEMDIDMTRFLLEKCASLLEESFPALEYLRLGSQGTTSLAPLVIPDNFLGNSAPRLRVIRLQDTVFPSLPRLLSTSHNLVSLQLENIPVDRIFTAQELAVGLSPATQLESLKIDIQNGAIIPRPLRQDESDPRSVLPALLKFEYVGESWFLSVFASRIETPIIEQIGVSFYGDFDGYDTYELCALFARGEELRSARHRTTHIRFFKDSVAFTHHFTRSTSSPGSFRVRLISLAWLDEYVSLMWGICLEFQSLGIMHKVTRVEIEGFPDSSRWHREVNTDRWLALLRTLSGVKRLHIVGTLVSSVVTALAQVSGEESGGILPALRDLHLPDRPGTSADIEPFIASRTLYGRPVSVHYKGLDWHDDCSGE